MTKKDVKREGLAGLLKEINMSETYSEKIISAFDKWAEDETAIFEKACIKKAIYDDTSDQARTIMLFLLLSLEEYNNGLWTRYPRNVFIDTMADFSSFVRFYKEATGKEGYGKGTWPIHYAEARIFRFGSFEFEIISEPEKKRVEMHIPEGAEFNPQALDRSIELKNAFFSKYLPDWNDIPIECHSWLLSPVLKDMLPEGSKILWFQSMFDIFDTDEDNNFFMQFVFDLEYFQWCNGYDLTKLPEKTSLQRKLKQFVINGGKPGIGLGYLKLSRHVE